MRSDNSELPSALLLVLLVFAFFIGLVAQWEMAITPILEECEQNLPRTEKCVLVAVPESEVSDG